MEWPNFISTRFSFFKHVFFCFIHVLAKTCIVLKLLIPALSSVLVQINWLFSICYKILLWKIFLNNFCFSKFLISLEHPNIFYEFLKFSTKLIYSGIFPCGKQILPSLQNMHLSWNAKHIELFFSDKVSVSLFNYFIIQIYVLPILDWKDTYFTGHLITTFNKSRNKWCFQNVFEGWYYKAWYFARIFATLVIRGRSPHIQLLVAILTICYV